MPALPLSDVQALIDGAKSTITAVSWSQFGDRLNGLILLAVDRAFNLANTGAEKKQIVLDRVSQLVDALQDKLPLPWFLSPFRGLIFSQLLKPLVLTAADGLIEAAYRTLKELRAAQ